MGRAPWQAQHPPHRPGDLVQLPASPGVCGTTASSACASRVVVLDRLFPADPWVLLRPCRPAYDRLPARHAPAARRRRPPGALLQARSGEELLTGVAHVTRCLYGLDGVTVRLATAAARSVMYAGASDHAASAGLQVSFVEPPEFDFDITLGTAGAKLLDAVPMLKVCVANKCKLSAGSKRVRIRWRAFAAQQIGTGAARLLDAVPMLEMLLQPVHQANLREWILITT